MLLDVTARNPNALLVRLPPADRDRIVSRCKRHDLEYGTVLAAQGEAVKEGWFPTTAAISQIHANADGALEVAMIGYEGFTGIALALGPRESLVTATVQGAGEALKMPARAFREEMKGCEPFRDLILRFTYVQAAQMARDAACNRYHSVQQRLAWWMLMLTDRVRSRRFRMTHDVLAMMLGVRRAGVTAAMRLLQARRVLAYSRGDIEVLDRAGLERAACDCYLAERALLRLALRSGR